MINEEKINNWNKEYFITYLYVYVADSDYSISKEEIDGITQKVGKIASDKSKVTTIVSEVMDEIKHHSFRDRDNVVMNNVEKYLKTDTEINEILSDLEEIIKMDGQVDSIELLGFRFIRNALHGINTNV